MGSKKSCDRWRKKESINFPKERRKNQRARCEEVEGKKNQKVLRPTAKLLEHRFLGHSESSVVNLDVSVSWVQDALIFLEGKEISFYFQKSNNNSERDNEKGRSDAVRMGLFSPTGMVRRSAELTTLLDAKFYFFFTKGEKGRGSDEVALVFVSWTSDGSHRGSPFCTGSIRLYPQWTYLFIVSNGHFLNISSWFSFHQVGTYSLVSLPFSSFWGGSWESRKKILCKKREGEQVKSSKRNEFAIWTTVFWPFRMCLHFGGKRKNYGKTRTSVPRLLVDLSRLPLHHPPLPLSTRRLK